MSTHKDAHTHAHLQLCLLSSSSVYGDKADVRGDSSIKFVNRLTRKGDIVLTAEVAFKVYVLKEAF